METEEIANILYSWLKESKFGNYKKEECMYIEKDNVHLFLFTYINRYSISANNNYLGCISQTRKPRAGEDWNRGNDLADGPFSKETWNNILKDIVGYELVDIKRPIQLLYKKGE